MGIVNLYKGLNSEREIFTFNGKLRGNLDLDWEHAHIVKNGLELDPDYVLQENDIIIIHAFPGALSTGLLIVLGVATLGVGIGVGIYAHEQVKKAQKEMQDAIDRLSKSNKQKEVSSIPQLGDARNEKMDGKNAPIILGRHLFAPYFLSEPYMMPEGTDGEDLYWYGTFLVGQSGLCFEKIRNGQTDLVTFTEDTPQRTTEPKLFDPPISRYRNDADWTGWATSYGAPISVNNGILRMTAVKTLFSWHNTDVRNSGLNVNVGEYVVIKARLLEGPDNVFLGGLFGNLSPITDNKLTKDWRFYKFEIKSILNSNDAAIYSQSGDSYKPGSPYTIEVAEFYITNTLDDPPFYTPENFIEIVQKGNEKTVNEFNEKRFEQKWADSLDSTVELGRKKKEGAKAVDENGTQDENGKFMDDDGEEPVIRETARFPMRAEIEIFLPEGLYSWDSVNGVETPASVEIKLEWSKNNSTGWRQIPVEFPKSQPKSGGTLIENILDKINGILNAQPQGTLTRAKSSQMRFIFVVDFPPDVYTKAGDPVFIRATRITRMHTGTYRSRIYLSAIRTQQYNPNFDPAEQPDGKLVPAKNINDLVADKFCRLGIKLKANKNTQENLDRFNVIASMTGIVALGDWAEGGWEWNGRWSTEKVKTSNSAAVLLELITGLIHEPSKHKDSELDLASFGKLYEFCMNRQVTIKGRGRQRLTLECNGVLTSGTRKIDAIQSILATCDGGLYINEFGKLEVYYEDTQTAPIALLNRQRMVSMVNQKSLERKTDGYTVEFIDQDSNYTQTAHRILKPRIAKDPGKNTWAPMKLDFTTSYNQAMWHARRLLAKEEHRPGELKAAVGKEGRFYKPGSLIKVQDERFKIGLGSGEVVQLIKSGDKIVGLKLMEKFDISKDRDYWVEWYAVDENRNRVVDSQTVNGARKKGIQIQSAGEYTDTLMFTVPMNANSPDLPAFMNPLSVMYGESKNMIGVQEAKRYIVTDLSENELGYDLTLAEYAEDIYRDSEIEEIEERKTSILSAPPVVLADQDRLLQAELIRALQQQTNPQNIDRIATGTTERVIPVKSPRYRGGFYQAGTINEEGLGVIGGEIMNPGDWVSYLGPTEGGWEHGYCYEWTIDGKWSILAVNVDNMGKYTTAVRDLCDGAPNGYFSILFCKTLVTVDAFIENLYMQRGTIREDGFIQSAETDPVTGKPLLLINKDGIEAINGLFNGRIEADSGVLNNITILENALFQGNISSGPLIVSAQAADDTPLKSYPAGTTPFTIYNEAAVLFEFDPNIQTRRSFAVVGTYNNRSINFIEFWLRNGEMYPLLEITVFFEAGGSEIVARHFQGGGVVYPPFNLQALLNYRKAIFIGKTLRLVNIPTTKQETGSGILWRDGDILKIS